MRDARAMQAAGALKAGTKTKVDIPSDVLSRHMTMGSWHASLSKSGQYHRRSSGGGR